MMIPYGAPQLAASFRTVRKNTIQIATDIPESSYDFVPASGARSLAQMLTHVALSTRLWQQMHALDKSPEPLNFVVVLQEMHTEEKRPRSKDEIIGLLRSRGDEFSNWLESLPSDHLAEEVTDPSGRKSRLEAVMGAKEHEMHHRGQLMLVERLLGIEPHLTRVMNERMAQMREAARA